MSSILVYALRNKRNGKYSTTQHGWRKLPGSYGIIRLYHSMESIEALMRRIMRENNMYDGVSGDNIEIVEFSLQENVIE